MNLYQLFSVIAAWLAVASTGYSFASPEWFFFLDLGAQAPRNSSNNSVASSHLLSLEQNNTPSVFVAHVGLWEACIEPKSLSLSPSPAPNSDEEYLKANSDNHAVEKLNKQNYPCHAFMTTDSRMNATVISGNVAFESSLLFARTMVFLGLVFSIFSAAIITVLVSGVMTRQPDKALSNSFHSLKDFDNAMSLSVRSENWQHRSLYVTCLSQALFSLLGMSAACLALQPDALSAKSAEVNFHPILDSTTKTQVYLSLAFVPSIAGTFAAIVIIFMWRIGQRNHRAVRHAKLRAKFLRDVHSNVGNLDILERLLTHHSLAETNAESKETKHGLEEEKHSRKVTIQRVKSRFNATGVDYSDQNMYMLKHQKDHLTEGSVMKTTDSTGMSSTQLHINLLCLIPVVAIPPAIRTLVLAHLPEIILHFFSELGNCTSLHPDDPSARYSCASVPANEWKATFDTIGALVSFVSVPLMSAVSDIIGRRPIVMLSVFLQCLPLAALGIFPNNIWWYFGATILPSLTSSTYGTSPVVIALVAEMAGKKHKSAAIGIVFALSAAGFSAGTLMGAYFLKAGTSSGHLPKHHHMPISDTTTQWICFGSILVTAILIFWVYVTLPETVNKAEPQLSDGRQSKSRPWTSGLNPLRPLFLLKHSRLLQCVGSIVVLSNLAESGVVELFLIYLNDVVNFTALDNAYVLLIVSVLSLFVQTAALRWLLLFGECLLITVGLSANAIHLLLYCIVGFTHQKWIVDVLCIFTAFTFLPMTAISSIVSHNAPTDAQGLHLGTLAALRSLSSIIGPAMFTPLYIHFRGAPFYVPEAPFYGGALMVICAIIIVRVWLPRVLQNLSRKNLPPSTAENLLPLSGQAHASHGVNNPEITPFGQSKKPLDGEDVGQTREEVRQIVKKNRRSTKFLHRLVETAKTNMLLDGRHDSKLKDMPLSSSSSNKEDNFITHREEDNSQVSACTPENLRKLSVRKESSDELRAERIARLLQTSL